MDLVQYSQLMIYDFEILSEPPWFQEKFNKASNYKFSAFLDA